MSDVAAHKCRYSGHMEKLSELNEAAGRVEDFLVSWGRLGTRSSFFDKVKQALQVE